MPGCTCHDSRTNCQLVQVRLQYVPISPVPRTCSHRSGIHPPAPFPGHHPAWEPVVSVREPQVANGLGGLKRAGQYRRLARRGKCVVT